MSIIITYNRDNNCHELKDFELDINLSLPPRDGTAAIIKAYHDKNKSALPALKKWIVEDLRYSRFIYPNVPSQLLAVLDRSRKYYPSLEFETKYYTCLKNYTERLCFLHNKPIKYSISYVH